MMVRWLCISWLIFINIVNIEIKLDVRATEVELTVGFFAIAQPVCIGTQSLLLLGTLARFVHSIVRRTFSHNNLTFFRQFDYVVFSLFYLRFILFYFDWLLTVYLVERVFFFSFFYSICISLSLFACRSRCSLLWPFGFALVECWCEMANDEYRPK